MAAAPTAVLEVSTENVRGFGAETVSRVDEVEAAGGRSASGDKSVAPSLSLDSLTTQSMDNDLDESMDAESLDLQIQVHNPQKHVTTLETYITFHVTTKTTRSEFSEKEYSVRRRYNDFLWLRQKMVETYPTHIIPPLPEKHSLLGQLDRYAKTFILARMALLHCFLNRISRHPTLSFDSNLVIFLTAKPSEFDVHRKSSHGFLGKMSTSLQSFTTAYSAKERTPEFEAIYNHVGKLGEKLGALEKIGHKVLKERQEYCSTLQNIHPLLTLWASSEPELQTTLQGLSSAFEKCALAQQDLIDKQYKHLTQPLKEYLLYVDAVKDVLARRDGIQISYEHSIDELHKKKEHLKGGEQGFSFGPSFWKSPDEVKEDRESKLVQAIDDLKIQVESSHDKLECANENLRVEMDRWQEEKKEDLKKILLDMTRHQMQMYEKCLSAWEEAIPQIKGARKTQEAEGAAALGIVKHR